MKNKLFGFLLVGITFVMSFFWFQKINQNMQQAAQKSSEAQPLNSQNAAQTLPPEALAIPSAYPIVNQQRLQKLAGSPYKGPSYKVNAIEMQEMVAERKKIQDRVPASK